MLLPLNPYRKRRYTRLRKYVLSGVLFIALVSFLFSWLYRKRNEQILALYPQNELNVGMCIEYKPYEFRNEEGEPIGFDVDVARELGKCLHKKVVFKDLGFDALILALVRGEIDLIISAMAITIDRCKKIDMIPYYGEAIRQVALLFWQKLPRGVATMADLALYIDSSRVMRKPALAVQTGTLQEKYARSLTFVDIRTFDVLSELIMDIRYGKSIAALVPTDIIPRLRSDFGSDVQVITVDLPQEFWSLGYGIGLNKQNKKLYKEVEEAVNKLQEAGIIDNLARRWF